MNEVLTNRFVTMFSTIGKYRNFVPTDKIVEMTNLVRENSQLGASMLMYSRDVRGGLGNRQFYRDSIKALINAGEKYTAIRLITKTPEIGRWDDVIDSFGIDAEVDNHIASMISEAINQKNGLAAKWFPRNGVMAAKLRTKLGYSPKKWRKTLVELTKVVETQMCNKEWENINFSQVPSIAQTRYAKAFARNAPSEYAAFRSKVSTGEVKINVGATDPSDIYRMWDKSNENEVATAMWDKLDLIKQPVDIFPIIDVSGSMAARATNSLTCMDVAIGMGLYVSENSSSQLFKNKFITFDSDPKMLDVSGMTTLSEKFNYIKSADWGGSTDIQKSFELLLTHAIDNKIPMEQMPKILLVITDMAFNGSWNGYSKEQTDKLKADFLMAGYDIPRLVWWNVSMQPTHAYESIAGEMYLSGYATSTINHLATGDFPTQYDLMMEVLSNPRYQ